jgi:hypothetical protein
VTQSEPKVRRPEPKVTPTVARVGPTVPPTDEAGFAGGAEGLIFGLLIFVVGTLLVAAAWGVVDTKMAVSAAAEDATRTYVEASDAASAGPAAQAAADQVLTGYGRSPGRGQVSLVSGGFARCRRVTIEVRYPIPLLDLPFVGRVGAGPSVTAVHSELVDPYRSGLGGTASCA